MKKQNTTKMVRSLLMMLFLYFLTYGFVQPTFGQICDPPRVNYIVRDRKGKIIDAKLLDSPKFTDQEVTSILYKNKNVSSIEFRGPGACNVKVSEVSLQYAGQQMHLIFGIDSDTYNRHDKSHYVIDSLPFHHGTYKLNKTTLKWVKLSDKP